MCENVRFLPFSVLWQLRVCTKVLLVESPQLNARLASTRAAMISRYTFVRLLAVCGLAWAVFCGGAWAAPVDTGVVRGVAWNGDNSPIANGRVRLRNIETGRVMSASETSSGGQFVFGGVAKSSYLVELVSDNGKVLAVGPAFRIEPGQTVSTYVRLPTRRWYSGMFSNAATAVIAAASGVGLTAVGTHAPPISPQ
jgi:hypothetical protein